MSDIKEILLDWQNRPKPVELRDWMDNLKSFNYHYLCNDMNMDNREESLDLSCIRTAFETGSLENYSGSFLRAYELDNNKDVICHFYNNLCTSKDMSSLMIKKLHKMMVKNAMPYKMYATNGERPGEYRRCEYNFNNNVNGMSPDVISNEMEKLFQFMQTDNVDALKVATVAHCQFQSIRPFPNKNGRMGRLMTNYYLLNRNYPPIIFFSDDRFKYFDALRRYDENPVNLQPMYQYLTDSLIKTYDFISEDKPKQTIDLATLISNI